MTDDKERLDQADAYLYALVEDLRKCRGPQEATISVADGLAAAMAESGHIKEEDEKLVSTLILAAVTGLMMTFSAQGVKLVSDILAPEQREKVKERVLNVDLKPPNGYKM